MKSLKYFFIIVMLIILIPIFKNIYTYRTMDIYEAIRSDVNEIKEIQILFNNETKKITNKDEIKEFVNFFDGYKIKRDKDNEVIRINNELYMFNIIDKKDSSYMIPFKNQITIDGYNYNVIDDSINMDYFDNLWNQVN